MKLLPRYVMQLAMMLLVFFVAFTGNLYAQDLNASLPTDPAVIKGKLPNGLTYYIRPNHKPENKVELRLVVNAGSILEDNNQLGLAHFMEHMNFNGTTNFQKNDLVGYLQSIGVQFGADLNAYTSFDETVFILPIPTDKPGNLEKGFQIIEDWAHNALLTDSDIDGERGVVLEESRLGKGANMRMLNKYFPKLASGTLYAERLPIGKDEILKNFKYETVRKFYHDWYRPDLQAVIVVGDIDKETALKMIKQHFEGLKNPPKERERTYVDVKPRTRPDGMVVTDKEASNSTVRILFPYTKQHDEITLNDYREHLKRQLVLQMLNTRYSDLANGSNPPFPFAVSGFDNQIHGYEAFTAIAAFGNDGPEKAINALAAELLRVKKYGFTQSELDIVKKDLMSGMEKTYNERTTTDSRGYVGEYIRNFLAKESMPGIQNEYDYCQKMLAGFQLSEMNGYLNKYISNANTFTLVTAPDKSEIKLPSDADLITMAQKAFSQDVKPNEEKAVASSLMDKKPIPGKVISQKTEDGLGAITYTLSNGIKVTIKPTDFKSDEIVLNGVKKGGNGNYGLADISNVRYMTGVIKAMGFADFSPTDIEKITAGKEIRESMFMGEAQDAIGGNSTVKDFEILLQEVNLYITQPRIDTALFSAFKQKQKNSLQFLLSNPQMAFNDTMRRTMYNNNPLANFVPRPEDFDKINLSRTLEIYKNEFGTADGYHFFIVGNVKPEVAIPLIETYLGSLPKANKEVAYKDNGVRPIEGQHTLAVKMGKDKKSLIAASYYGETKYSEDLALDAQALAEVLNIKVIQELREKMGAIYGGGFNASVVKEPYEHYNINLRLPCGPENVDKLLAAANEEIKAIKENGPDTVDLNKVKSQFREKHIVNMKENQYWSDKLESIVFWGREKDHVLQYEQWLDKLTPADIKRSANQLFNGKNQLVSILYPAADVPSTDRNTN